MSFETSSLEELAEELEGAVRVGVDGIDGVRKTSISLELSRRLKLPVVSLDDFLKKNQGGYAAFISHEDLNRRLNELNGFIVEGVCLLRVLENVKITVDSLVYVKRFHLDCWADSRELTVPPHKLEEFLASERRLASEISHLFDESTGSADPEVNERGLTDEIICYHSEFRPFDKADVVYRWDAV